jgi:hypothetical protein
LFPPNAQDVQVNTIGFTSDELKGRKVDANELSARMAKVLDTLFKGK